MSRAVQSIVQVLSTIYTLKRVLNAAYTWLAQHMYTKLLIGPSAANPLDLQLNKHSKRAAQQPSMARQGWTNAHVNTTTIRTHRHTAALLLPVSKNFTTASE